ncbi:hypothetical protein [Phytomonospora endophytica]|uniref:Lipoprotein n=1 Tax=Phytomonospora endophytica TaxID=714109 RepID=A0A841G4U1_9ACTN|nr:hypothetical protein [Phytomonospora endophytica]MBB6039769.1 hypothetical protein [Phytomonospora endophytica]
MTTTPRALLAAFTAATVLAALAACSPGGRVDPGPSGSASRPAGGLPGRVFYLGSPEDFSSTSLHEFSGGKGVETVEVDYATGWSSLNVSNDGSLVSYVSVDGQFDVVDNEIGGEPWGVAAGADPYCVEPVWSPQGVLLYGMGGVSGPSTVRVVPPGASRPEEKGAAVSCHYRYSADGTKIMAGALGEGAATVMDADLTGERDVTFEIPGREVTDLVDVGPGARRFCVSTVGAGEPVGDVTRAIQCDTVIDAATGQAVPLPLDGVTAVRFTADGSMLLRTEGTLTLIGASGEVVATVDEPAAYAGYSLLAYIP